MSAPTVATPIIMDGDQLRVLMEGLTSTVVATMMQQQQQQQQHQGPPGGNGGGGRDGGKPRLNARGWENLDTFGGGEEKWMAWSWKAKVATGAMDGGVKRLMDYAEGNVGKELGMMVNELGAMGEAWDYGELTKASSELYSLLVRYTKEEAATVVKRRPHNVRH